MAIRSSSDTVRVLDLERTEVMQDWGISLDNQVCKEFSQQNHTYIRVDDFMNNPQVAITTASLQKFAKISPQYPGVRAPIPDAVALHWLSKLSPMLDICFGKSRDGWEMQAWFSVVTCRPNELIPMQCLPHVDGVDPDQIAMMLYLHQTDHGGTSFFQHRSTGFSELTASNFPVYQAALQKDAQEHGLPRRAYVTDGAPFFDRIYKSEGGFNQAIFYRGNVLHSGVIDNDKPLPSDPGKGRLTINAFFRPIELQ